MCKFEVGDVVVRTVGVSAETGRFDKGLVGVVVQTASTRVGMIEVRLFTDPSHPVKWDPQRVSRVDEQV